MGTRSDAKNGETESAALQIHLLGAPQVTLHGEPLDELTSAKAQALLFYLAVTERAHTRPALAALLWGNFPEKAARGNLRKALQHLRKHLGDYVAIERDTVALAEDADVWVDALAFQDGLEEMAAAGAPTPVETVLDLYRGDFLEGFYVRDAPDFESWWLSERERLRELLLEGLHAQAERHADQGDLEAAADLMQRFLDLEPWREEAHRRLMTWLALDGQRGAALAQYAVCRETLAEELGVEPAEETTVLYERIRDGDLRPIAARRTPTPVVEPHRPAFLDQDGGAAEGPREPFVGRERELEELAGFLGTALAGQGRVAFVRGEAGWGKTRLLEAFSRRAQEEHGDLVVASGACTMFTGTADPYLPFREVLNTLCADVEEKWAVGRVTRSQALRLWDLLPDAIEALVTHGPHLIGTFVPSGALLERAAAHGSVDRALMDRVRGLSLDPGGAGRRESVDQTHIFEEVADVVSALAGDRPLLLILDDLHWADASSTGLLFHLGRRVADSRVLILGAYRPEEVALNRQSGEYPLESVLDEFKRLFGDVWVDLGEDGNEARAFVDALLDSEPNRLGDPFRERLARTTGGHPLFTVEILRDMQEQGYVHPDEAGRWVARPTITWDTLPERVEGVIERRLNRLKPRLWRALAAASVEGETFTAEVVARVCGIGEADMVAILSGSLAKRHRLVEAGEVRRIGEQRVSRYHFSHNLFQKHLYHTLDPAERAYRHEAVGDALEDLYEGHTEQVAVQLASHFRQAGRLRKAVAYLKQAGDAAAGVYANPEAVAHYRQAIDLACEIEGGGDDLTTLFLRLGRALELDSRFDEALEAYQRMEEIAVERDDRSMELASVMARATVQSVPTAIHNPERARDLGERALTLAEALGDQAAEARILWSLCLADHWAGRWREAAVCGERSLALARELDLREQLAQTQNDLGRIVYLYSGRIEQAKASLREASELWRELGNKPMLADSLASSAAAHVFSGDYDRAIALSNQALDISRSIGNVWGQAHSLWKVGFAHWDRGEVSRAIKVMEMAISLGEQTGSPAPQSHTRTDLAALYREMGMVERGAAMAEAALAFAPGEEEAARASGGEPRGLPHCPKILGALARLDLQKGDLERAEARIEQAKANPYHESWPILSANVVLAEGELALEQGAYEACVAVMDGLIAHLREWGMRAHLPEALHVRGLALRRWSRDASARQSLREARAAAEAIGSRRTLWRILRALSVAEDDSAETEALRQEAQEVVRYIVGHTRQTDLRASFLSLPEVRDVLAPAAGG